MEDEDDVVFHHLEPLGRRYCRRPGLSPELSLALSFSLPDLLALGLLPPRVIRPPDFCSFLSPPPLGARVSNDA